MILQPITFIVHLCYNLQMTRPVMYCYFTIQNDGMQLVYLDFTLVLWTHTFCADYFENISYLFDFLFWKLSVSSSVKFQNYIFE